MQLLQYSFISVNALLYMFREFFFAHHQELIKTVNTASGTVVPFCCLPSGR